jgi:hypothetical protein
MTAAAAPSTSPMFAMFEPTTLPSAMTLRPSSAANVLTTNSGIEVP